MNADRRQFLVHGASGLAATVLVPELAWLHPRIDASAPLPIAVIGTGRQGRLILGELATLPEAKVVAVCDTDDKRLQSAASRAQDLKAYANHAELLAKESSVAAVVVATPTHAHKALVLDALKAGKHVFCETPLAHTLDDCKAIAEAARSSGKVVAGGFQGRSNPVYALARTFVRSGALRTLTHLRAQDDKKTSWRTQGSTPERDKEINWHLDPALSLGLAGEKGSHQLDVFHWFLNRHPVAVRGWGEIRIYKDGREVPDTIGLELRFEDGLRAMYGCTLGNGYEGRYELLAGEMAAVKLAWTHGWMFKEADAPTQGWEVYANRQQFHNDQGITLIADATKLAAQGKLQEGVGLPYTSLYYALADFVKACAEGKTPACTVSDAARSTVVAILANEAIKSGGEVSIDPKLLESL